MVILLVLVISIIVAVGVLVALKSRPPTTGDGLSFESREVLFSPAERSFLGVLEQALADGRYKVFGKVRLGDIVKPAKGLNASKRTTAQNRINQKHVDFLICTASDLTVVGVVELDDQSHNRDDRAGRDRFVDDALTKARIPVVRFPAKNSYAIPEVAAKLQTILPGLEETTLSSPEVGGKVAASVDPQIAPVDTASADTAPVCEKCSSTMVKRQAKNGQHAGKFFWACSTYPKCRNVVAI